MRKLTMLICAAWLLTHAAHTRTTRKGGPSLLMVRPCKLIPGLHSPGRDFLARTLRFTLFEQTKLLPSATQRDALWRTRKNSIPTCPRPNSPSAITNTGCYVIMASPKLRSVAFANRYRAAVTFSMHLV